MAVANRVLAGDRFIASYNALMAGVWALHLDRTHFAPWIVAAHMAALTLPWLFARLPDRSAGWMTTLRDLYPLVFLLAYWPELDLLHEALLVGSFDNYIVALDQHVFGTHLHAIWMPAMPYLWLSELMYFMYFAYYALIFLPPIVVAVQGRRAAVRDMAFRLMVTYVGCYLIYITFPVLGPRLAMEAYAGPHTDGLFYQIVHGALEVGDSRGTAFPSSHVAGGVTIAYLAWRWFSRPVALLMSLEATGILLSTVYTQSHYAIDAVAGLAWALGLQVFVVPMLRFLLSGRRPAPTPVLPDFAVMLPATGGTGDTS